MAPPPPPALPPAPHQTPKVFKAAAWVAIAAGIVFIVAVIFFTGFRLGMQSGHGGYGHHRHHKPHAMMHRMGGPNGGVPAVSPGGPAQVPSSVAPATTPGR
ncbi:hypothetical protein LAUMK4_05155 [Mycobacterium persicum]|uniref:Proline rich protein n=1 Tax=Mycobacterium persicum TaxID=1487726 RepID=A0ABY6RQM1_9MYCO|nr:hypothetical protein LAUMK15_05553 [Mycobacterium persicum]VBA30589.1 hypothetical protein LAUMK4_05155 [Mycobacterium persicum]